MRPYVDVYADMYQSACDNLSVKSLSPNRVSEETDFAFHVDASLDTST